MKQSANWLVKQLKAIKLQQLATNVSWFFWCFGLYAAQLTWKFVPEPEHTSLWQPIVIQQQNASHINLSQVDLDDFFGDFVNLKLLLFSKRLHLIQTHRKRHLISS